MECMIPDCTRDREPLAVYCAGHLAEARQQTYREEQERVMRELLDLQNAIGATLLARLREWHGVCSEGEYCCLKILLTGLPGDTSVTKERNVT